MWGVGGNDSRDLIAFRTRHSAASLESLLPAQRQRVLCLGLAVEPPVSTEDLSIQSISCQGVQPPAAQDVYECGPTQSHKFT